MPIYDLKCPSCEHSVKDLRISFEERDKQICPECQTKLIVDLDCLKPSLIGVG